MVWASGAVVTAAQLNANAPQEWTAYTPTWTGGTTNPTLGNGTLEGRYARHGDTVHFQIKLVIGASTTIATGIWYFALPTPARSMVGVLGDWLIVDQGARTYSGVTVYDAAAQKAYGLRDAGASDQYVTNTTPHAWAAPDTIWINGTYEAA